MYVFLKSTCLSYLVGVVAWPLTSDGESVREASPAGQNSGVGAAGASSAVEVATWRCSDVVFF